MTSPLLVFSDDWGRHPSSCQHLIRHLVAERPVAWVNTIGTRSPKLDWATFKRVAGKLRQWVLPKKKALQALELPANMRVYNPKMWPYFRSGMDRAINRKLLLRHLMPVVAEKTAKPIAITTLPIVADLVGKLPVERWVYYCVDDFSQWPGLDQQAMDRMERLLVSRVDRIVAVSETLRERMKKLGRSDVELLTHGVDADFWQVENAPPIVRFSPHDAPLVLFWGVIDRRMDLEFVRQLSRDLTEGTILLVGPTNEPDPELFRLPRVQWKAAVPIEELPKLAAEANVLIMPYADLPVTRAMQPLKLKEYLATGKAAVARDLPANRDWSDALDLAANPKEFSDRVRERLKEGVPAEQLQARQRLKDESWSSKARQFQQWID